MKKYRSVWVLIISMFFMASAYTMLIPFLPLYLLELGVSQARVHLWTGLVFSSAFFVAGIMGPVWGKMADTRGKKRMAVRAAFLIGCSYFLGGIVHNEWQLLGMRIFQGFANGLVAASMAIISSTVEEKALGTYLGFAQTSIILGGHLRTVYGRGTVTPYRNEGFILRGGPVSLARNGSDCYFCKRTCSCTLENIAGRFHCR